MRSAQGSVGSMVDSMLCDDYHPVAIINAINADRYGPAAQRRARGAAA